MRVMDLAIPHTGSDVADVVTISIGIVSAGCVKNGVATDLVIVADKQLYTAKSRGRNCVMGTLLSSV